MTPGFTALVVFVVLAAILAYVTYCARRADMGWSGIPAVQCLKCGQYHHSWKPCPVQRVR